MNNAFYIAATGMRAHQTSLDAVATNLVNANTIGYKRTNIIFSDLVAAPASVNTDGNVLTEFAPVSSSNFAGSGVSVVKTNRQFDAGDIKKTESVLDVAIQGDGFIEVSLPDGGSAFTRGGTLKINGDGVLLSSTGLPIKPTLIIPDNAKNLVITSDGTLSVTLSGQSTQTEIGHINLTRFNNPSGLSVIADNLYRQSEESGEPKSSQAGENGTGLIAQGMLEYSNVKMVDEMMSMMLAQRAYEASLKVLQAADELSAMTNNLRKG